MAMGWVAGFRFQPREHTAFLRHHIHIYSEAVQRIIQCVITADYFLVCQAAALIYFNAEVQNT